MSNTPVSDSWERGNPYEQYIGRWSRQVAPLFLSWLGIPAAKRWLDLGCGTGALCAAIVDQCAPISVTGVEPSGGFLKLAAQSLAGRVELLEARAASIPLADASVDVTVSGLVLNFVPDVAAALAEMIRVTVPGGTIAAYVWDYADGMELIRLFWDVASDLDAHAKKLHEGARFPLCNPDALVTIFGSSGLRDPQAVPLDLQTHFSNFEEYWNPFLGGQGPAPAYAMSLPEDARTKLRDRLRMRLPTEPNGSIRLTARVWAIRASTASNA